MRESFKTVGFITSLLIPFYSLTGKDFQDIMTVILLLKGKPIHDTVPPCGSKTRR